MLNDAEVRYKTLLDSKAHVYLQNAISLLHCL